MPQMYRVTFDTELKFADVPGKFSGMGAVFGNADAYGDVIAKGAFSETLRDWERRAKYPPMLLMHGGVPFGGSADAMLPVGKWDSMEETSKGLRVEGALFALGTERGQYLYEGLKSGAIDGLSIGYAAKKFTLGTKPSEPRRILESIDLKEVSIVTFPANDQARIGSVKSSDHIKTIREYETAIREELGFSHARAKAIASHGFKADPGPRDEDADGGNAALARLLRSIQTPRRKL
jgi:hypothetical protein